MSSNHSMNGVEAKSKLKKTNMNPDHHSLDQRLG